MTAKIPTSSAPLNLVRRQFRIGFRSALILFLLRMFLKPLLARMVRQNVEGIARTQLRISSMRCPDNAGLEIAYRVLSQAAGHMFGTLDAQAPVVLWLHGGAFILPAAPTAHLPFIARICRDLGAAGFAPDYRLAPANPFPTGLDDCERAYRALLDMGCRPSNIVLGGDSAGGNLVFGVLQRIRKAGLPMPACAVALSPVSEMGRVHAPPSRPGAMREDALLPIAAMSGIGVLYAAGHDTSDPELSPLYMDCRGLPPLLFLASDHEILMDDTLLLAERAHAAGVVTEVHLWNHLPHAFPLFETWFPEAKRARPDIVEFARRHLK